MDYFKFCLQADHQVILVFFGYREDDTVYCTCEDERSIIISKIFASVASDFFFDVTNNAGILAHKEEERWQSS